MPTTHGDRYHERTSGIEVSISESITSSVTNCPLSSSHLMA
jgi:hypothetical protein